MLKDSQSPRYSVPRTRRTYTVQFKAELLSACKQPGASIAALALQHGMNANVLHRWLKGHRQGTLMRGVGAPAPAFIPIDLAASLPVVDSDSEPSAPPPNIRIEIQQHAMQVMRADCTRLITAAARWPARRLPANSQLFLPMANGRIWFRSSCCPRAVERA